MLFLRGSKKLLRNFWILEVQSTFEELLALAARNCSLANIDFCEDLLTRTFHLVRSCSLTYTYSKELLACKTLTLIMRCMTRGLERPGHLALRSARGQFCIGSCARFHQCSSALFFPHKTMKDDERYNVNVHTVRLYVLKA